MSEENVEIVRRSIAAFEDDEEAWLAAIDPSHVWYPLEEGNIPSHGLDAARAIRKRWLDSWASHPKALAGQLGEPPNRRRGNP